MPRPTRSFGRPGTKVIPDNWSAMHRPVAENTMTGLCAIRHPGTTPGSLNTGTGARVATANDPHYTGACRVQPKSLDRLGGALVMTGEEQVGLVGYLVTVPLADSESTNIYDLIRITDVDGNGDVSLVGRDLVVQTIARGTLAWERDLLCIDTLT